SSMGFGPSAGWAQAVADKITLDADLPRASRVHPDQIIPDVLPVLGSIVDDIWALEHVDDHGEADVGPVWMNLAEAAWEKDGVESNVKKKIYGQAGQEVQGYYVRATGHWIGTSHDKRRQLTQASIVILMSPTVLVGVVDRLVGKHGFAHSARAPLRSTFEELYPWLREARDKPIRVTALPDAAWLEIFWSTMLLPLAHFDISAPWTTRVECADSSMTGLGRAWTAMPESVVRNMAHLVDTCQPQRRLIIFILVKQTQPQPTGRRPGEVGSSFVQPMDSACVSGAFCKGRSASRKYYKKCRKHAAIVLVGKLEGFYPWVPSADNPADRPSRIYEPDKTAKHKPQPDTVGVDFKLPPALAQWGPYEPSSLRIAPRERGGGAGSPALRVVVEKTARKRGQRSDNAVQRRELRGNLRRSLDENARAGEPWLVPKAKAKAKPRAEQSSPSCTYPEGSSSEEEAPVAKAQPKAVLKARAQPKSAASSKSSSLSVTASECSDSEGRLSLPTDEEGGYSASSRPLEAKEEAKAEPAAGSAAPSQQLAAGSGVPSQPELATGTTAQVKPEPTAGTTAPDWESWRFSFASWIGSMRHKLPALLEAAAKSKEPIQIIESDDDTQATAIQLNAILVAFCSKGNCGQEWLRAVAKAGGGVLAEILEQGSELVEDSLQPDIPESRSGWEHEINAYESETGKIFDVDLKVSILNDTMDNYLKAKRLWTRSAGNTFGTSTTSRARGSNYMDIGGKGGKGKDKSGKSQKGAGSPDPGPQEQCTICWKWHAAKDCWYKERQAGKVPGKGKVSAVDDATWQAAPSVAGSVASSAGPSASQTGRPRASAVSAVGEGGFLFGFADVDPQCGKKKVSFVELPTKRETTKSLMQNEAARIAKSKLRRQKKASGSPEPDHDTIAACGEYGEVMIDSGACDNVAFPGAFDEPVDASNRRKLWAINNTPITVHGRQSVEASVGGEYGMPAHFDFAVTDSAESVLAVSKIVDSQQIVHFSNGPEGSYISNMNGQAIPMVRRGKRYYIRYQKGAKPESLMTSIMAPFAEEEQPHAQQEQEEEDWEFLRPFNPDEEDDDGPEVDYPDDLLLSELLVPAAPAAEGLAVPTAPTEKERALHLLTHSDFAPWCSACVAGKAREDHHRRSPAIGRRDNLVHIDYQFYSRDGQLVESEAKLATVLTAVDTDSGACISIFVPRKGTDTYLLKSLEIWLNKLGHEVTLLQFDQENPVRAVAEKLQKLLGAARIQLRESPRYSHASNGAVEAMNGYLAGQVRTWLLALQEHYPLTVMDVNHLVFPWLVRHIAWLATRYRVKSTDKCTPYRAINGRDYTTVIAGFGEVVMGKFPDTDSRSKSKARWAKGIFVGRLEQDDSVVILTEAGALSVRSVRRLPIVDRYGEEVLGRVCGLPWAPKDGARVKMTLEQSVPVVLPARQMAPAELQEASDDEADNQAEAQAEEDENEAAGSTAPTPAGSAAEMSEDEAAEEPGTPAASSADVTPPASPYRGAGSASPLTALATVPPFPSGLGGGGQGEKRPGFRGAATPPGAKVQRIGAMNEDDWEFVQTVLGQGAQDDLTQQMASIADYMDSVLDPAQVETARLEELGKLYSLDGYLPELVRNLPYGSKLFPNKWVDKNSKGRYRSRLTCADLKSRYSKQELLEEISTHCPTPYPESHALLELRMLLEGWSSRSADVISAFLIGKDAGDSDGNPVYMRPPKEWMPVFKTWLSSQPKEVQQKYAGAELRDICWQLVGNLHGRRTAGAVYRDELEYVMVEKLKDHGFRFTRGRRDPCVYRCATTGTTIVHHVGDFRATGSAKDLTRLFDTELAGYLKLKKGALEEVGTKVDVLGKTKLRTEDVVTLPDEKHTDNIVVLLGLQAAKSSPVPSKKLELTEETTKAVTEQDASLYRSAVGSAIYLSRERRDIQYAAKELARHMREPRVCDFANLKLLGRYLIGARGVCRIVAIDRADKESKKLSLHTCTDSDWAGCAETRRSTDGVTAVIGGAVTMVSSQTQPGLPASSSGEAETRGLARGSRDTLFLRKLAEEDFGFERLGAGKLRHLDICHFATQELVRSGQANIGKVPGVSNPANVLTKHVNAQQMKEAMAGLGLLDLSGTELETKLQEAKQLVIAGISDAAPALKPRQMPWKPRYATAASVIQICALSECMSKTRAADWPALVPAVAVSPALPRDSWDTAFFVTMLLYAFGKLALDVWALCRHCLNKRGEQTKSALEKEGERAKPDSVAEDRAKPATGSEEQRSEITYFFKTRKGQKAHLYRSCHTIVNSRESDVEKTLQVSPQGNMSLTAAETRAVLAANAE
ncbi:unnamed protein product, partial [Polarella glacialis]